ncbi:MAG: class I SAM-dependent methyltransferase [Candidatus Nanoarchaeia archaeon]|nr:class I SAM-dependent methyltransferase [Candidatus Nanoarchaeia archaeon]MDD5054358.1 class I SAM-dependent methyltransferase [Candidatus Nanoarchaeia archaeon]MDD5499704.1 class I SAM-dependent methyltransferase [Candidatus Nanoarchaeia archaeon]
MDKTKEYYLKNSESFIDSTFGADMSKHYSVFLRHVKPKGKILDAGCGSGRDSIYFKSKGFEVIAIDYCNPFVKNALSLGVNAKVMSFNEIKWKNHFDGIWACASLLHLKCKELRIAFDKMIDSLKVGGIFYASFKHGDFFGIRDGRYFVDLNEKSFGELLKNHECLEVLEIIISPDVRNEKKAEWFSVFFKKNHF